MSTEPTALPAAVVAAIDEYGVTCANVVKMRTSPEWENWAREKLEDAIRSHLAAPTVVRAGGGVTTERLRELRAECEQRRDEAQASANYHEGSGNDARWQGEADFFAAIRDIIDSAVPNVTDAMASEAGAIAQELRDVLNFAYRHGYHEHGVDIIAEYRRSVLASHAPANAPGGADERRDLTSRSHECRECCGGDRKPLKDCPDCCGTALEGTALRRKVIALTRERDNAYERVMDFTGAPTIDEAFAVIIAPVEWDALASYHGVVISARQEASNA